MHICLKWGCDKRVILRKFDANSISEFGFTNEQRQLVVSDLFLFFLFFAKPALFSVQNNVELTAIRWRGKATSTLLCFCGWWMCCPHQLRSLKRLPDMLKYGTGQPVTHIHFFIFKSRPLCARAVSALCDALRFVSFGWLCTSVRDKKLIIWYQH